jgi:hypothetical protein
MVSVRPQMVDLGSGQGRRDFETGGVAHATSRISKYREQRSELKDAVCGRTLIRPLATIVVGRLLGNSLLITLSLCYERNISLAHIPEKSFGI